MGRLTAKEIALQIGKGRLRKVGSGYQISCPCPGHEDNNPSCSIWDTEKGYIGVHCHSRCGSVEPREALMDMGFIPRPAKTKLKYDRKTTPFKETAKWIYHDPEGKPYQVNKRVDYYIDDQVVGKDVFQFRADGWSKLGRGWKPYLYNLPAIIAAAKAGRVIIAAEGEGKADILKDYDRGEDFAALAATTHSGGCKNTDGWLASEPWKYAAGCQYWAQLEDNDEMGVYFAVFVCYHMHKHGIPVKRIPLPGLGPVKPDNGLDVKDWLGWDGVQCMGHSVDELLEVIGAVDLWTPENEPRKDLLKKIEDSEKTSNNVIDLYPDEHVLALTEMFNADHFKELYQDKVIWVPEKAEQERWHINTGTHYKQDSSRTIRDLVEKANALLDLKLKTLRVDADERRRHLRKSCNRSGINNTLFLAEHRCAKSIQTLDQDIYSFNMRNFTIDLTTMKERKHSHSDLITKFVDVDFNPKAKCPQFMEFLKHVFDGDQELIRFDQLWTGYMLTGDVSEQKLVIGYSQWGASGKSTLSNIKLYCAGGYGRTVPASMFLLKKTPGDVHSDSLDRLVGYRLINVLEIPAGAKLNDQLLKDATGGEPLEARPFGAKPYPFMPQFKLNFRSNFKPGASTDEALWRRIWYQPFLARFPEGKQIKYFDRKLWEAESEGILLHYLTGAASWHEDGSFWPDRLDEFTKSVKNETDYVKQFVARCMKEIPGEAGTPLNLVHQHYEEWRKKEGFDHNLTPPALKRELERLGYTVKPPREKAGQVVQSLFIRVWESD